MQKVSCCCWLCSYLLFRLLCSNVPFKIRVSSRPLKGLLCWPEWVCAVFLWVEQRRLAGLCGWGVSGPATPPADLPPAAAPPVGPWWLVRAPLPGLLERAAGAAVTQRLESQQKEKFIRAGICGTSPLLMLLWNQHTILPVTLDFLPTPFSHPACEKKGNTRQAGWIQFETINERILDRI